MAITVILLILESLFISTLTIHADVNNEYINTYNLSGAITVPNAPPVKATGTITINATETPETIAYVHKYHADAESLGYEDDIFTLYENKSNKTLDLTGNTNTSIRIIWDIFGSFGKVPLASFYHITSQELTNKQIELLNMTVSSFEEVIYLSSELEKDIKTYKIVIPLHDDYNITLFYDTTNLVLLGFDLKFQDHRVFNGAVYELRLTLSETTLDLPVDRQSPYLLVVGVITGIVSISLIGYLIIRRLRSPEILEGGLD